MLNYIELWWITLNYIELYWIIFILLWIYPPSSPKRRNSTNLLLPTELNDSASASMIVCCCPSTRTSSPAPSNSWESHRVDEGMTFIRFEFSWKKNHTIHVIHVIHVHLRIFARLDLHWHGTNMSVSIWVFKSHTFLGFKAKTWHLFVIFFQLRESSCKVLARLKSCFFDITKPADPTACR